MNDIDDLYQLLLEYTEHTRYNKLLTFKPDGWHREMFQKGATERVRGVLASNRCGKSYAATFELCCHLTGLYPDWWDGHKFAGPIDAIALGSTWSQMMGQKAIHELIFGPLHDVGSGWLPRDRIISTKGAGQLGAFASVDVRHVSGEISTLKMATYGQGDTNLMGSAIAFFLVDEDPDDSAIINQLVKRGWSIKDSRGLCVMTPEHGRTKAVEMFWDEKGIYHSGLIHKTLFDSTLYTVEEKKRMIASIEPWARQFSIYGIPSAGAASVFQGIEKQKIIAPCPPIQPHWKRLCAIDFGKKDTNVVTFIAYDESTEHYYMYDEIATEGKDAIEIAPQIVRRQQNFIPMICPVDGKQERGTGVTLIGIYKECGVKVLDDKFTANWMYDPTGKNRSISTGISFMRTLFLEGRLTIDPKCQHFLKEFDLYGYDDNGKFIDKFNHAIDSARYCLTAIKKFGVSYDKKQQTGVAYIPEETW